MPDTKDPPELKLDPPPKDFYRILIVDDEETIRKLLGSILKANGYTSIVECRNGDEALAALKAEDTHLVLLDKNMPGIDGLEVLKQGKQLRPGCEFIVITAYGSMETAIQAMDLGAFSYVTKPFPEIGMIVQRIENAIERVRLRNENEVLLDRLRHLLADLGSAEAELETLRAKPAKLGGGTRITPMDASGRLRRLSAQLEHLKASGKAAEVFRKISREVTDVADLLEGTETIGNL